LLKFCATGVLKIPNDYDDGNKVIATALLSGIVVFPLWRQQVQSDWSNKSQQ